MIGKRNAARRIIRGIGGKAFPKDYNWECPVCGYECRAFEYECSACLHEDMMVKWQIGQMIFD